MSTRVNYDDIAHLYDDRRRDHGPDERLGAYLSERALQPSDARVLDIGCGTGKQLAANLERWREAPMIGVDRSAGMLRIARARSAAIRWIRADAAALPLPAATIDYATNQFSYPHIQDKRGFVAEVFRVLRRGGRFVLTNIDPWAMEEWVIYKYFPQARALDERDFLPRAALARRLGDAGFTRINVSAIDRSEPQRLGAFLASAEQRHSASQLIAISDADYEAGLRRLRKDVARSGTDATIPSQFVVLTITADKA